MSEQEVIKSLFNKFYDNGGRNVKTWKQIEQVITETYHARDAEVKQLQETINELNMRGENLTRDFNNAKKLLNQFNEANDDLKTEIRYLKENKNIAF